MSWHEGVLIGFDVETTGLDVENDRIVTASYEIRKNGFILESKTIIINPGIDIPQAAIDIHGLSNEFVKANGTDPKIALKMISDKLVSLMKEDHPLVGFNIKFDLGMLENELARHGLPTLKERFGGKISPVIDPLVLDRWVDKYRKGKRTLSDLIKVYNVKADEGSLHASRVDVTATLDVLYKILEQYPHILKIDIHKLRDIQEVAHRNWAEGLSKWLMSQGKEPIETDWI